MDVDEQVAGPSSAEVALEEMTSKDYYFDSYARYSIHEDMLKDEVRTLTYRDAMYRNRKIFSGKVVMDIGCGTGILSMFAAKAGAKRVYAVECSKIVNSAIEIIRRNNLDHVIVVIEGKLEEISLPAGVEKVDIIISEWMGYCLLYESMLETIIYGRDKYLKPGGYMFPDRCALFLAGVNNRGYKEDRIDWWNKVYGFDMSVIRQIAINEPVVDCVEPSQVKTNSFLLKEIDLYSVQSNDIDFVSMFQLYVRKNDYIHAFASFFTVEFTKCDPRVGFTTAPGAPHTHWKQTLFYLNDGITVKKGDVINGHFHLKRNSSNNRGLDITIDIKFKGALTEFNDTVIYKMH